MCERRHWLWVALLVVVAIIGLSAVLDLAVEAAVGVVMGAVVVRPRAADGRYLARQVEMPSARPVHHTRQVITGKPGRRPTQRLCELVDVPPTEFASEVPAADVTCSTCA